MPLIKPNLGRQIDWGHPLARGLVARWVFNEGVGRAITDHSGRNPGTLTNGPIWQPGPRGSALLFDGSDDFVAVPSITSTFIAYPLTMAVWAKVTAESGDGYMQLASQSGSTAGWMFLMHTANKRLGFQANGSDFYGTTNSIASVFNWNRCVHVIDASGNGTWYVNGIAAGTHASYAAMNWVSGNLQIGKVGTNTSEIFNGQMDDVSIWSRALSADEIRSDYAEPYAMYRASLRRVYSIPGGGGGAANWYRRLMEAA